MVHFCPRLAYFFSSRRELPDKKQRFPKSFNPLDDFKLHTDMSDTFPYMEEISIVMRGRSFDRKLLPSLKRPIFLQNWVDEPRIIEDVPQIKGKDIYYISADQRVISLMNEKGQVPITKVGYIWFDDKGEIVKDDLVLRDGIKDVFSNGKNYSIVVSHRSNHLAPPMSTVVCIAALCEFAEKINIYGWDQFLDFEPAKHGYWKTLFGLTRPRLKHMLPRPGYTEAAVYNWHYAYRFCELPFINIHGRLNQLRYHPKIMKKIEKVFYND